MRTSSISWTAWKLDVGNDTTNLLAPGAPVTGSWSNHLHGHGPFVVASMRDQPLPRPPGPGRRAGPGPERAAGQEVATSTSSAIRMLLIFSAKMVSPLPLPPISRPWMVAPLLPTGL